LPKQKSRPFGVTISKTGCLKPAEVQLLTDLLRSSRVLTREHSDALSQKLASLLRQARGGSPADDWGRKPCAKAANERTFLNLKRVYEALADGKKLSFHYCQYAPEKTRWFPAGKGSVYLVNPCMTLFADGYCYLLEPIMPLHEGFAHIPCG
jgi:hypothetical protein